MRKSVRILLAGLTAVSLLLTSCTQPTTTPIVAATAVPATATASPPTPTPEPAATPTLTAQDLRDQRATAVLTTLSGYNPTHHDALLPLARHLWGESDLVDPAEVTIVAGETAVRVNADATGSYPPGTLFLWRDEELLLLVPAAPDQTIQPGTAAFLDETLPAWVEYDGAGQMVRFLHPDAAQWLTPLDLSDAGDFSLFLAQEIAADEQPGNSAIWWANGRQPIELTTSPDPNQSLTDYLAASQLQLTQTEGENGRYLVALANAQTGELAWTFDADSGQWHEAISNLPTVADLPRHLDQAQSLAQYDDIVLSAENARINLELGRMEYYDQNGVLAAFSAIAIDANGRITHLTDEAGNPLLHFAAIEQLQARSHQMPVTYNGQQIETKVQVHFDHPRLMNAGLVVEDGYLDSVYRLWEQRITGLLQTGQIVANSLNPDPNAPHFLTAEERLRLRESGTFHFYVNFYPKDNPLLRGINPSPAYRPHVSSGAAGPIRYWGYYYDPINNELHATALFRDDYLDDPDLRWRLLGLLSQPMVPASKPHPETIKTPDSNWMAVADTYERAMTVLAPWGVPASGLKVTTTGVR